MLANDLIDRLERLGLLDQEIIEALRQQLEQSGTRVTPEAIAKLLVDNGQLTKFQATKLIGELRSGQYEDATPTATAGGNGEDLAVITEDPVIVEAAAEPDVFAEPIVEAEAVPVMTAEPVAVEAVPMEAPAGDRPVNLKRPVKKENVWDSFKVYGFIGILAFLILGTAGLFFLLRRGSSDDFIQEANKLYDQQNYAAAQKMYGDFLESFGQEDQYASLARTRIVMTELYQDEQSSNPTRALDTAKAKLPSIENEEGLNEERGNLAALLVDIADNITVAAGRAPETTEKQSLLTRLEEQIKLIENPVYMTSAMRTTLAGRLQSIAEGRARVERDINRNLKLDDSVAGMQKALESKDTKAAYDVRTTLLREFPELRDNERLVSLVKEASAIQQTLVTSSAKLPEVTTQAPAEDSVQSVVLTTRMGESVPGLDVEHTYLRAGGSVLAFACDDGRLLWRKFVGFGQDHEPVSLEEGAGVLLSNAKTLEVQRCDGTTGKISWRAAIGEPFGEPIAVKDRIFVPVSTGRLVAMDAVSGDADWAVQLPQPIDVAPALEAKLNVLYQPGDHSNLYVLNGRNGEALESFYIGHSKGTIAVPPVALLGHVFVFENAGTDFTQIHVLRYDESGKSLRIAQAPFRLTGNVTVPPWVQERRIVVLTDRGQVEVYDVEPTAEREQVSVAARQVASYDRPTSTQMAVSRNQMWITGTRIGGYDLQINTGNVRRSWVMHEGDTFIGQPLAFEEALIHARVLRGTSGIRVTAADPKTGREIWRTDVGVPVTMITAVPNEPKFHTVTSQAALFELDRETLQSGSTTGPIENPGTGGVALRFENPLAFDNVKRVMLNQQSSSQIVFYDPARASEKLRLITLGISDGKASGPSLVSGGGLMIPLDTGRIALVNVLTGTMLGSPFHPASEPEAKVTWTQPVALADDPDQVVIADSRQALYRLRIGEQIRELAKVDLPEPLLGPAAQVDGKYVAGATGPAADFLVGRDMASLDESFRRLLDGRIVWGPVAVGDFCVLQTNDGQLRAFDGQGEQRFATKLPAGTPIGEPIQVGESVVLAGATGWIANIDAGTGELLGQLDLGQPLSATPFLVGKRLLIPGQEGVIYIVNVPEGSP